MRLTRRFAAAIAGLAALGTMVVAAGGAASGGVASASVRPAVTETTCTTSSATANISPGVLFTTNGKQTITATFSISGCNAVGSPPATAVSGNIKMSSKNLTCISGKASGTFTSTANNSSSSTSSGSITLKATSTALKFTISGTVKKGFLAGSKIKGTFTATPVKGNCTAGSPLTEATIANNGNVTL
ncbi:MAG: hypothetical protein ABSH30_04195 [Acidimicrobiales bacterium]|jgi:hypothetical protein